MHRPARSFIMGQYCLRCHALVLQTQSSFPLPFQPSKSSSFPLSLFSGKTTFAFLGHARARVAPSAVGHGHRGRRQPAPWFCALHGSQSLGWLPRMDRPRPQTTMTMMTISDHSNSNVTIARLYLSSGRDNREREAAGNDKIKCESGPEKSF